MLKSFPYLAFDITELAAKVVCQLFAHEVHVHRVVGVYVSYDVSHCIHL